MARIRTFKSDPNCSRYGVRYAGERGTREVYFASAADRSDWLDANDVDALSLSEPRAVVYA